MGGIHRKSRGARTDKLRCVETNCYEVTQINTEYYAADQRGGIYGPVYLQFFTTALPSSLTAGDNVSRLLNVSMLVEDGANRYMYRGWAARESKAAGIYLEGIAGKGNIVESVVGVTLIEGWVEYTK